MSAGRTNKKGQVTVFMIVGVVLVLSASFIFYYNSKKADKVSDGTTLKADDFENYIKTCLKDSLKDNIVLLGLQGGMIYESQNGLFPDFSPSQAGFFYILSDDGKVPFLLDKPYGKQYQSYNAEGFESVAPYYPWVSFPYKQGAKTYVGYFGISRIPPLIRPQNYSFEEEIESAVLAGVKACDLSSFETKYEVKHGDPNLKVSFQGSVVAQLDYPITITEIKTGAKKDFSAFKESLPVRLDGIHAFAAMIIQKDAQNITYDISGDQSKDYIVAIRRDATRFNDDLIIITDKSSKIDNKPYKFQFARKNRLPALENIPLLTLTRGQGHTILGDVRIQIKAIDPDEDNLIINVNSKGPGDTIDAHCSLPEPRPPYGIKVNVTDGQYNDYEDYSTIRGNLNLEC